MERMPMIEMGFTRRLLVTVAALAFLLAGCAARKQTVYLDEDSNFGAVRRVALLRLENYTGDLHAADKVAQILTIELLEARVFELADDGEVRRAMADAQVGDTASMRPDQVKFLGEKLEVEALLTGAVQELTIDRSAGVAAPTISLHFKMVDAVTGQTIWSTVVSRHGAGATARLFGMGGKGTNEAIRELVRDALATLIR